MALGLSSATATAILDAIGNATAFSYAAVWIQLHTADPGAAGTTAVAGNATRKQVSFGAAAAAAMSNDANIDWTAGEVDTNEVYTHVSLWSLETAGVFIASGTMTANAVVIGNTFRIPTGDLDITFPVAA